MSRLPAGRGGGPGARRPATVAGRTLLPAIDALPGYDAHLVTDDGRHLATPGFPSSAPSAPEALSPGAGRC
jgi:hypothetical protein